MAPYYGIDPELLQMGMMAGRRRGGGPHALLKALLLGQSPAEAFGSQLQARLSPLTGAVSGVMPQSEFGGQGQPEPLGPTTSRRGKRGIPGIGFLG